jgi:hypothetical protein
MNATQSQIEHLGLPAQSRARPPACRNRQPGWCGQSVARLDQVTGIVGSGFSHFTAATAINLQNGSSFRLMMKARKTDVRSACFMRHTVMSAPAGLLKLVAAGAFPENEQNAGNSFISCRSFGRS